MPVLKPILRGLTGLSLAASAAAAWAQSSDPGVGITFNVASVPLGGPLVGTLMSAAVVGIGMWGMRRRAGRGLLMVLAGVAGLLGMQQGGSAWATSGIVHPFTSISGPAFQSLSDEVGSRCDGLGGPGSEFVVFQNDSGANAEIKTVFTRDSTFFGPLELVNNPSLSPQCAPGLSIPAGDSCTVEVFISCVPFAEPVGASAAAVE